MNHLKHIHEQHQGKISDKWNLYLESYDQVLHPYRPLVLNLLEIGVQNGGSLEVWSKYFSHAHTIIGCDINSDCSKLKFNDSRIHLVIGDATQPETYQQIKQLCPTFDIIIDDGSHTSGDIIKTFCHYFDSLNDGGVFIFEDLHCSYWHEFNGGLNYPFSSIAFFKQLVDIINYEHWGINLPKEVLLNDFITHYQIKQLPDLSHIHSVEFINSVCIIKKAKPEHNVLGRRNVTGIEDVVIPQHIFPRGSHNTALRQEQYYQPSTQQQLMALQQEFTKLNMQYQQLLYAYQQLKTNQTE